MATESFERIIELDAQESREAEKVLQSDGIPVEDIDIQSELKKSKSFLQQHPLKF